VAGGTDDPAVTVSATRDRGNRSVVLHVCNPSADAKAVSFKFSDGASWRVTRVVSLSAPSLEAHNTPDDPDRVSPQDVTASFQKEAQLRPYSYTVVVAER
jgi:alpha-L-arabinofuranosidase